MILIENVWCESSKRQSVACVLRVRLVRLVLVVVTLVPTPQLQGALARPLVVEDVEAFVFAFTWVRQLFLGLRCQILYWKHYSCKWNASFCWQYCNESSTDSPGCSSAGKYFLRCLASYHCAATFPMRGSLTLLGPAPSDAIVLESEMS